MIRDGATKNTTKILSTPLAFDIPPIFVDISSVVDGRFQLIGKLEGFNPGGSIKLKPAKYIVETLEKEGVLERGAGLIDTSSGNMGVALALVAKAKGYRFVCVSDDKVNELNRSLLEAYGAELVILPQSTLEERRDYIRERKLKENDLFDTHQFTNPKNVQSHLSSTVMEVASLGSKLDYLFCGVGTGGTIAALVSYLRINSELTKVVGVDNENSYHFRTPDMGEKRRLPGIGSTVRSVFLSELQPHFHCIVSDNDTVSMCLRIRDETGWLLGASSGTAISAVVQMADRIPDNSVVLVICPDLGERYLESVYSKAWRIRHLGWNE